MSAIVVGGVTAWRERINYERLKHEELYEVLCEDNTVMIKSLSGYLAVFEGLISPSALAKAEDPWASVARKAKVEMLMNLYVPDLERAVQDYYLSKAALVTAIDAGSKQLVSSPTEAVDATTIKSARQSHAEATGSLLRQLARCARSVGKIKW